MRRKGEYWNRIGAEMLRVQKDQSAGARLGRKVIRATHPEATVGLDSKGQVGLCQAIYARGYGGYD